MTSKRIHIVTTLQEIRGSEIYAFSLAKLMRGDNHEVRLWSDRAGPNVARYGGTLISAFDGRFPRGGTLIIVGTWVSVDPWIAHAKPERVIVVCVTSNAALLFELIGRLKRAGLPEPEMVYMSRRLMEAMTIPGRVTPVPIDLDRFSPAPRSDARPFTVGRVSRDTPDKHHPEDPSLYRMLAWQDIDIRILGGTCLAPVLAQTPRIDLLPSGTEDVVHFLRTLDVFFYRTHPSLQETAGLAIMEALATGIPIVAHISGGYTDWIDHGKNGYLFSTQEEAWESLLHLRKSPELRQTMSIEARASALRLAGPEALNEYRGWLAGT